MPNCLNYLKKLECNHWDCWHTKKKKGYKETLIDLIVEELSHLTNFHPKCGTSRLLSRSICGGISLDNLLDDRARYISLDK